MLLILMDVSESGLSVHNSRLQTQSYITLLLVLCETSVCVGIKHNFMIIHEIQVHLSAKL